MSYNQPKLNVVKIQDPRISTVLNDEKKRYCLLEGGSEYNQKVIPNLGTATFTSLNWTAPPSNPQTVLDPLLLISYPVQVDFVGTNTSGGNLLGGNSVALGPNDGFRSLPIASLMSTISAKINGQQVSYNLRDYIHTIEHMHNCGEAIALDESLYPAQRDVYQDYGDYTLYGGNRNPFTNYGGNSYVPSRGSFPIQILSNTSTTASIRALITEPVILSPFYFGKGVSPYGMTGIQSLELQINFDSNLGRIWSHANNNNVAGTPTPTGIVLTSVTPSFYGPCNLLMNEIKLKDYMIVPRSLELPYFYVNNYPSAVYSLAQGASVTVQLQNVQLSSVPEKFLLWARQQNSDQTYNTTETFAQFNKLNLQFDVKSGLFATATTEQLWRMSRDNGSDQSYHDWIQFQGGICVGMFGKDVGLDSQTVPGRLGTWNFQPTVTITNISTQSGTINFNIFETIISEGVCTIKDNQMFLKTGVMSQDDIKNAVADNSPYVDYSVVTQVYGGDFLSSLKSIFYKALPYIKKYGIPVAKALLGAGGKRGRKPRAKKAGVLDGYDHLAYDGGAYAGGKKRKAKKSKKAGAMSGGKKRGPKKGKKRAGAMAGAMAGGKKRKMTKANMVKRMFGSGLVDDSYMEKLIKKYDV